jgi:hypothetical protein
MISAKDTQELFLATIQEIYHGEKKIQTILPKNGQTNFIARIEAGV